ncbi:MAG: MOSC domain-containing protein [marine benthic group bacterium]|nr:MOSC domain-containing protein [Gemmatimonadota bacterium]
MEPDSVRVTGIYLYPLKSAAGFAVEESELDRLGLVGDRRWMLVDAEARALTQREVPRLARVHAIAGPDGSLEAVALGMPALRVLVPSSGAGTIDVRVLKRSGRGIPAGEEAAAWFSEYLEVDCRLLYLPPDLAIPVKAPWGGPEHRTAFSDGFPVLLIGDASLADLNRRLERPVPMDRFRPNLVVEGTEPYEEDAWDEIRIGGLALRAVKPCPRCVVTTVDQVTGIPDASGEPLATLSGYRRRDGKVWFGMNLLHRGTGTIRLGDAVRVVSRRDAPEG